MLNNLPKPTDVLGIFCSRFRSDIVKWISRVVVSRIYLEYGFYVLPKKS
jgi:hypothetical protein